MTRIYKDKVKFVPSMDKADIQEVYNFNVEVFANTTDFKWTLENINKEISEGWQLYAVKFDNQIVAALFTKVDNGVLYTKNTPLKLDFQGNGFSHQIKTFYEERAKEAKAKAIVNYSPVDNFRMIALNESHGYQKTGNALDDVGTIIEWKKSLK